jgi:mono/diheme cytochrome c family protein
VNRPRALALAAQTALATLTALLTTACAPAIPRVTPDAASRAGADFAHLSAGRELYVGNCGGCHRLSRPGERTAADWAEHMPEMAKEAKLTPEETAAVTAYLTAFARVDTPATPATP